MGIPYAFLWIVLLAFPAVTAWKRYWAACAVFAIACLLFLYEVTQDHEGWDSLTDLATLLVVILPLYVLGLIVWAFLFYLRRRNKRKVR